MLTKQQIMALHFSLALQGNPGAWSAEGGWRDQDGDWLNLDLSKVTQVMLPFTVAHHDLTHNEGRMLRLLAARGITLILRLPPADLAQYSPGTLQGALRAIKAVIPVRAVIVLNEPDIYPRHFQMIWGKDWGNSKAQEYAAALTHWGQVLQGQGVQVIAGAMAMQPFTEDDPAIPGVVTWMDTLRPALVGHNPERPRYQGMGLHFYGYDWPVDNATPWLPTNDINITRFKHYLRFWQSVCHLYLWIDETMIDRGDRSPIHPVTRMRACIGQLDLLLHHPLGERAQFYCPFVSNGDGKHYPGRMIVTDRAAYEMLGLYMQAA